MKTGGGFAAEKVPRIASFPMEPAEHCCCNGRQEVSANGTELPNVTFSISRAFAVTVGAELSKFSLMPWEPMLFTVPNWPSARCVDGSARPLTRTGVFVESIPSK